MPGPLSQLRTEGRGAGGETASDGGYVAERGRLEGGALERRGPEPEQTGRGRGRGSLELGGLLRRWRRGGLHIESLLRLDHLCFRLAVLVLDLYLDACFLFAI